MIVIKNSEIMIIKNIGFEFNRTRNDGKIDGYR